MNITFLNIIAPPNGLISINDGFSTHLAMSGLTVILQLRAMIERIELIIEEVAPLSVISSIYIRLRS